MTSSEVALSSRLYALLFALFVGVQTLTVFPAAASPELAAVDFRFGLFTLDPFGDGNKGVVPSLNLVPNLKLGSSGEFIYFAYLGNLARVATDLSSVESYKLTLGISNVDAPFAPDEEAGRLFSTESMGFFPFPSVLNIGFYSLHGSGSFEVLAQAPTDFVTSMTYDQDSNTLYWVDQINEQVYGAEVVEPFTPSLLYTNLDGVTSPGYLKLDGVNNDLYWLSEAGAFSIQRAPTDGGGPVETVPFSSPTFARQFELLSRTGRRFFRSNIGDILSEDSDGANESLVYTGPNFNAVAVQQTGESILYATIDDAIMRGDALGGTPLSTTVSRETLGFQSPRSTVYDPLDNNAYWHSQTFYRKGLGDDELPSQPLAGYVEQVAGVQIDSEERFLYWVVNGPTAADFSINRVNLDAPSIAGIEVLYTSADGVDGPLDLALDTENQFLYWTEPNSVRVLRAPTDGSGPPEVLYDAGDGLTQPQQVTLDSSGNLLFIGDRQPGNYSIFSGDLTGVAPAVIERSFVGRFLTDLQYRAFNDSLYWSDNNGLEEGRTQRAPVGDLNDTTIVFSSSAGLISPPMAVFPGDTCPLDDSKITPQRCGCGVPDDDTDEDGSLDCQESCPSDPLKFSPGICGCGVSEVDSDGDSTPDCTDACPLDSARTDEGVCGCGASAGCICQVVSITDLKLSIDSGAERLNRVSRRALRLSQRRRFRAVCGRDRSIRSQLEALATLNDSIWTTVWTRFPTEITSCTDQDPPSCEMVNLQSLIDEVEDTLGAMQEIGVDGIRRCREARSSRIARILRRRVQAVTTSVLSDVAELPASNLSCSA